MTSQEQTNIAIRQIQDDMVKQVDYFNELGDPIKAQRIKERVEYDMEMIKELGHCSGIENYSRYFDGRQAGDRPYCLLDFFPDDYLLVIDESHVSVPQINAMYGGDRARKTNLVEYGFRLPAAFDNRPLTFDEFLSEVNQVIYVSATPADFDRRKQRIVSSEFTEQARIVVATALPMQNPEIGGVAAEWRLNKQRDTLTLWCLDAKADTARLVLSDPTGLQDTLKLRFRPKNAGRRRGKEETSTPIMKALCSGTAAFYDDLRLAFLNPVVKVADSAIAEVMNLKDSSIATYPLVVDSTGLEVRIVATLRSGQEYRVRLREKLFTDIHGRTSDSLVFKLTPKDYGMLTLHVENVTGSPLVIEVLDSRDTVVQKMPMLASGTLRFRHLPAADYRLRAVVDVDGDGAWTPGDYMLQRQPESTIPFGKTLQLREKWEMEERWTVKVED